MPSSARLLAASLAAAALLLAPSRPAAQVPFPQPYPNAPTGAYRQDVFPYAGQCRSGQPGTPCANIPPPPVLQPIDPATQAKFQFEAPNPVDYVPDTTSVPGAHYYELTWAQVSGIQKLAELGLFPNPKVGTTRSVADPGGVPEGYQWTGLVDPVTKKPLYTPAWGIGQSNAGGGVLGQLTGLPLVSTWPSMSIRGQKGTPVVVKWVNGLPDQHVLCPYPQAWDWPCAIDRTLMGAKARTDPAKLASTAGQLPNGVSPLGSAQSPDNAISIHLHGGEIPPGSDGFAEKWFGNARTGRLYSPAPWWLDPLFEAPPGTIGELARPGGDPAASPFHAWDRDTYYYPMVQDESLIWFHDHALGKTRINVMAGPAGFFPIEDPASQQPGGANAWLNPLRAKNAAGVPVYDLFLAIQDRAFNSDGTVNYPNGMALPPAAPLPGASEVTPGGNPMVHPQWVPEFFGDHVTVNGVLWPRITVVRGVYRIRLLDGSNSRCYQLGLGTKEPVYATATAKGSVTRNVPFTVIADEQGYLKAPVALPGNGTLTLCPGERYEILVDFSKYAAGTSVYVSNIAKAPFPAGIGTLDVASPYAQVASILRFDVVNPTAAVPAVAVTPPATTNPSFVSAAALPLCSAGTTQPCVAAERQLYLNERGDPITLAPLGMQINGTPFEYNISETPKAGTYERWQIINTTVDAHPMHLHLVKFQIVQRQKFSVGAYKKLLCGSTTCTPFGGGSGNMSQVVPDVASTLSTTTGATLPAPFESGWKDTAVANPGEVLTVIARWDGSWAGAHGECKMNFPGVEAYLPGATWDPAKPLCFEPVWNAPYVWHCHIVDHEDSEMMRASLVVP